MAKDQDFYDNMGDDVDHPTVDQSLVNDAANHQPKARIEITEQVDHRQEENGETGLYLDKKKIGKLKSQGQQHIYEMAEGFELDNEKIYKKQPQTNKQQPKSYVEGCDMGWC
ncbi:hypothetical protein J2S74_005072 [Evansella vedderi]|uniref:Uncharacterized protein n=1 Tax=Evansella vedderi TaxID=38282 RepID=A0ABU0A292_9BACI|nr:DUF2553 family protein [Evansella vedderi]MDQ0257610.1 hypothetical protein [Evansella vedderi]